jgi:hypothetical protein
MFELFSTSGQFTKGLIGWVREFGLSYLELGPSETVRSLRTHACNQVVYFVIVLQLRMQYWFGNMQGTKQRPPLGQRTGRVCVGASSQPIRW